MYIYLTYIYKIYIIYIYGIHCELRLFDIPYRKLARVGFELIYIYAYINPNSGRGLTTWKFLEYSKNIMLNFYGSTDKEVHIPGLIKGCNTILQNFQQSGFILSRIYKGKSGIPRDDQEKIMLNFHESSYLTFEFPRSATQIYTISKGKERFISSRFSKGKVTDLKDPGFYFKKLCPHSSFGFLQNSPKIISYILISLLIVPTLTKR